MPFHTHFDMFAVAQGARAIGHADHHRLRDMTMIDPPRMRDALLAKL